MALAAVMSGMAAAHSSVSAEYDNARGRSKVRVEHLATRAPSVSSVVSEGETVVNGERPEPSETIVGTC